LIAFVSLLTQVHHQDVFALAALGEALRVFDGGVVLVSHNRSFLQVDKPRDTSALFFVFCCNALATHKALRIICSVEYNALPHYVSGVLS
jgi:hypothetical protein